jgi:phosphoribosyl 1,2-cyclic phosphodiesterase
MRNELLFDAFIVTHWDADHYEGVINFLRQDVTTVRKGKVRLSRAKYGKDCEPPSHSFAPNKIFPTAVSGSLKAGPDYLNDLPAHDGTWTTNALWLWTSTLELLGRNFLNDEDKQF